MKLSYEQVSQMMSLRDNIDLEGFNKALKELNDMVGLEKVKTCVYDQLAYTMMLKDSNHMSNIFMLNTLITGPPGVGKSKLANILGKIWASIGILKTKKLVYNDLNDTQKMAYNSRKHAKSACEKMEAVKTKLAEINKFDNQDIEHFECDNYLNDEIKKMEEDAMLKLRKCKNGIMSNLNDLNINTQKASNPDDDNIKLRELESEINYIINSLKSCIYSTNAIEKLMEGTPSNPIFKRATRSDLIGKHQGDTAIATKKILQESSGGVLFIDEAYQLINGANAYESDNFGIECLNTINQHISENPDKIILIMAGYADEIENNLFKAQRGLERRFIWRFDIDPYTHEELAQIIIHQIEDTKLEFTVDDDVSITWLKNLISSYASLFSQYAGDTQRLVFYTIMEYACSKLVNPDIKHFVLTQNMFSEAIKRLASLSRKKDVPTHLPMFS